MNLSTKACIFSQYGSLLSRLSQITTSGFYQRCVYRQAKQLFRTLHTNNHNGERTYCNKTFRQTRNTIHFNYKRSSSDKYDINIKRNHSCWGPPLSKIPYKQEQTKTLQLRPTIINNERKYTQNTFSKFTVDNPVYTAYLTSLVQEYYDLQAGQGSTHEGSASSDNRRGQISRFNFLRAAVSVIERLHAKQQEMVELTSLINDEKDSEMRRMMESEIGLYKNELQDVEEELVNVLVGDDPADNSDIMLEVTAGVGGQEAMLFCQEVFNMYCNYAVRKGWRLAEPVSDDSELGGARKASVEISGEGVHGQLKHEGGVHRVQRVPRTEKAGRIHTSTITVSVMPQPKEIDINLRQKDLKIETFRNSGPGGQSVNTTDSAVRITHIPSGTVAEAKEERSQIKNREIAMKKIKQRMYEKILEEQQSQIRASRKLQQGSRARSEKIRTYNFQQDRVTDHRTRQSSSNLAQLLAIGGDGLDGLIEGLVEQERHQVLEMMMESWEQGK